jgi:hypothetical protein
MREAQQIAGSLKIAARLSRSSLLVVVPLSLPP